MRCMYVITYHTARTHAAAAVHRLASALLRRCSARGVMAVADVHGNMVTLRRRVPRVPATSKCSRGE